MKNYRIAKLLVVFVLVTLTVMGALVRRVIARKHLVFSKIDDDEDDIMRTKVTAWLAASRGHFLYRGNIEVLGAPPTGDLDAADRLKVKTKRID